MKLRKESLNRFSSLDEWFIKEHKGTRQEFIKDLLHGLFYTPRNHIIPSLLILFREVFGGFNIYLHQQHDPAMYTYLVRENDIGLKEYLKLDIHNLHSEFIDFSSLSVHQLYEKYFQGNAPMNMEGFMNILITSFSLLHGGSKGLIFQVFEKLYKNYNNHIPINILVDLNILDNDIKNNIKFKFCNQILNRDFINQDGCSYLVLNVIEFYFLLFMNYGLKTHKSVKKDKTTFHQVLMQNYINYFIPVPRNSNRKNDELSVANKFPEIRFPECGSYLRESILQNSFSSIQIETECFIDVFCTVFAGISCHTPLLEIQKNPFSVILDHRVINYILILSERLLSNLDFIYNKDNHSSTTLITYKTFKNFVIYFVLNAFNIVKEFQEVLMIYEIWFLWVYPFYRFTFSNHTIKCHINSLSCFYIHGFRIFIKKKVQMDNIINTGTWELFEFRGYAIEYFISLQKDRHIMHLFTLENDYIMNLYSSGKSDFSTCVFDLMKDIFVLYRNYKERSLWLDKHNLGDKISREKLFLVLERMEEIMKVWDGDRLADGLNCFDYFTKMYGDLSKDKLNKTICQPKGPVINSPDYFKHISNRGVLNEIKAGIDCWVGNNIIPTLLSKHNFISSYIQRRTNYYKMVDLNSPPKIRLVWDNILSLNFSLLMVVLLGISLVSSPGCNLILISLILMTCLYLVDIKIEED